MGLREGALGAGQLAPSPAPRRRSKGSAEEMALQETEAERRLDELQIRLGLTFKRRELLREAMTHTSWINERGDQGRDNERLEYLGDAVLELVAGEYLFSRFPNYDEGQLTQMRSSLVSTVALARIGEQLLLGETLRLGRGAAKSGARRLTSLHANAFEALIGGIFLDQGYRRAGKVFLSRIGDLSAWTDPNFKGRLQALAQERFGSAPQYKTAPSTSDPRSRQYASQVSVEGHGLLGEGRGGTKQAAEQGAARAAIDLLVAPVSKKRRRRKPTSSLEPGQAAPAVAATTEVMAPPEAVSSAPEPASPRRRRRRTAASAAAATPAPSAVMPAAALELGQGGLEPIAVAAEPAPEQHAALPAAPRRRRRRSSHSQSAAPAEVPTVSAEASVIELSQGGLEPVAVAVESAPEQQAALPAARRRRRRSSHSQSAAAAEVATVSPATTVAAIDVGTVIADQPVVEPVTGVAAPRRRRRRSTKPVNSDPSAPVPVPVPVADDSSPTESAAAGGEGSPPKRSHRGHRGGRKRSGRAATPTVP